MIGRLMALSLLFVWKLLIPTALIETYVFYLFIQKTSECFLLFHVTYNQTSTVNTDREHRY